MYILPCKTVFHPVSCRTAEGEGGLQLEKRIFLNPIEKEAEKLIRDVGEEDTKRTWLRSCGKDTDTLYTFYTDFIGHAHMNFA